jgi:hypothetical protein
MIALRRESMDVQLRDLRRERRRAHAYVSAGALPDEEEALVVEMARCLRPVLAGLSADEQGRAARYLQLRSPAPGDGGAAACCLLPLVDETQRVDAQWVTRKERGRVACSLVVPPQRESSTAEDYPLVWTVPPAPEAAGAVSGAAAGEAA